jgi:phosphoribosylcarboxyaminoimidazole (NCAIR) mutase
MAAGKSGGANAALYALNILSVYEEKIEKKMDEYRKKMAKKISDKNKKISQLGLMNYINNLEAEK